ncbi:hypothetical protein LWI29_004465 [Acer saccharum]|uniref:Bifunctional inhibitor/plant lipid transfer protein/seed storage helical domain-containing protein n=1 Tax=Acer saccharum TaxID=4024 RepID=A0AA39SBJ9_ACESA|nr:hypothetical protein LWI29_004465 [Acer saccharum]KAK1567173.1 hypothetical protein Q3G72_008915 [Acer saccharum]
MALRHIWLLTIFFLLVSDHLAMANNNNQLIASSCQLVFDSIPYCFDYLMGDYFKPSNKCCNHVKKLNMITKHRKGNAQRFCFCIEIMTKGTQPPMIASRIQQLPIRCNTHLSFPISDSMDCSK